MNHPYLYNPDRERAVSVLKAHGKGGTATQLAQLLGWSEKQVRTFLKNLKKFGLAEVTTTRHGALIRWTDNEQQPENGQEVGSYREGSGKEVGSPRSPILCSKKIKRLEQPKSSLGDDRVEVQRLVEEMNLVLAQAFPDFQPVKLDGKASLAAGNRILAKIPLDRAVELVRLAAASWNPSKRKHGDLPGSLAALERKVMVEWELANKPQMSLFPKLDMHIERGEAPREAPLHVPVVMRDRIAERGIVETDWRKLLAK